MADIPEKKPAEPSADPRGLDSTDGSADEADMALAAMGYKPVRRSYVFLCLNCLNHLDIKEQT